MKQPFIIKLCLRDKLPTANWAGCRRTTSHIGLGVVPRAVGALTCRAATKMKIRMPGIAIRPAAGLCVKRVDLFGEGSCLDARRGGLLWRRRDGARRPRVAAAVHPNGGDGDGFDLFNRHRPPGQETKQNGDAAWNVAIAVLPTPDASRADTEQLSNAVLCEAERVKGRAEFSRGQITYFCVRGHTAPEM
jgi:hypothetical protein